MVRIADILKKAAKTKEKVNQKKIPAKPSEQQSQLPTPESPQEQGVRSQQPSIYLKGKPKVEDKIGGQSIPAAGIRISESTMGKLNLFDEQETLKLYEQTISLVKEIYDKAKDKKEIAEEDKNNIISYVEKFVDQQTLLNDNILNLLNLQIKDEFIYNHVVNVCIISIDLGLGLGYDREKLVELGTIAIIHDIGLVKFSEIYNQQRALNEAEYNEIKNHPVVSAEILKKSKDIFKRAISVVYQEHERVDGSGYPHGLKGDSIDEYAKIIGLADTYEAMTHLRAYRRRIIQYEVIKRLIEAKNSFDIKPMKVLIERIASPYPLSSYVKLSSGEKGRVIRRNLGCPLKPVIEIMRDASGEKIRKIRIIDLAKFPTIYIKNILKSEDILND